MSNKITGLVAAMSLLLTVGCNRQAEDGAESMETAQDSVVATEPASAPVVDPMVDPMVDPVAAPAMPVDAVAPTQPEALGMLIAINEHEIAAAEQARSKGVSGAVLEYADLMIEQHTENLAQTQAMVDGLVPSAEIDAMKAKGAAELATLAALEGEAYAKAYIDAMVAGHAEALNAIDTRMMPAATDETVRAHFTTTRGHVAMHLEEGNRILKTGM